MNPITQKENFLLNPETVAPETQEEKYCLDIMNGLTVNAETRNNLFCGYVLENSGGDTGELGELITRTIKAINIPTDITNIGSRAFQGCSLLESVNLPPNIVRINDYAFIDCSALKNVTMSNNVTYIGANAFNKCKKLESIVISSGVTEIPNFTFAGCADLKTVDIPEGITLIGPYAFNECFKIQTVICRATTPPEVKSTAFVSSVNFNIYVPAESVDAYKASQYWSARAAYIQAIQE